jgi:hypothetical protein
MPDMPNVPAHVEQYTGSIRPLAMVSNLQRFRSGDHFYDIVLRANAFLVRKTPIFIDAHFGFKEVGRAPTEEAAKKLILADSKSDTIEVV